MKKLVKILALALALTMAVMTLAACSKTEAKDAIVFGTNAEFPPFEYVTSNGLIGEYDGIDIAIVDQIAKDLETEVKISNMEFDSLLIALANGQIDAAISGMTITEERKETVNFSIPYYVATQVMIVKKDSGITKAADMADKNIAVIQGYTGEICVDEMGYEYTSFKKGTDAIMELVNGKCDVVVLDSATAVAYIAGNEDLMIVEDAEAFEAEEYGIAVAKENTELLEKLNTSIQKMLDEGKIDEWNAKYAVAE